MSTDESVPIIDMPIGAHPIVEHPGDTDQCINHILNEIQIETHPNSKLPIKIYSFDEYAEVSDKEARDGPSNSNTDSNESVQLPSTMNLDRITPWHPFKTREDFEFAELALETHMNQRQIERLIEIIRKAAPENSQHLSPFSIHSYTDLSKLWEFARKTRARGVSYIVYFLISSLTL